MLNDISAVPSWDKVAQGLLKMFNVEVVGKHPVIKHLKFGSILAFRPWEIPYKNESKNNEKITLDIHKAKASESELNWLLLFEQTTKQHLCL